MNFLLFVLEIFVIVAAKSSLHTIFISAPMGLLGMAVQLTRRISLRHRKRIRDAEAVAIHRQLALLAGRVIALQGLPLDAPGI